jgi:hypothetical protein
MAEAVAVMDLTVYAKYFVFTYTDEVYFFMPSDSGTVTDDGDPVITWQPQPKAMGSVQAYSGDLAEKEYGLKVECQKRIFLTPDTIASEGWGVAFSAAATAPELYVKWAPQNKTHRLVLAGTR